MKNKPENWLEELADIMKRANNDMGFIMVDGDKLEHYNMPRVLATMDKHTAADDKRREEEELAQAGE